MDTAIVYGIFQIDTNECVYIGSTTQELRNRIWRHRYASKTRIRKIYQIINCQWEAFRFEIIFEVILSQRFEWERVCYEHYNPIGNSHKMNVSEEEHKEGQKNRDNSEYYRKRRETNIVCSNCGEISAKRNISRHQKSQKCINFNK